MNINYHQARTNPLGAIFSHPQARTSPLAGFDAQGDLLLLAAEFILFER